MKPIFVTGIDTDAGKTIVSAILTEALQANYWKPVQAGDLNHSDTVKVKRLISNKKTHFFEETYRLTQPMSPHAAADIDKVTISIAKIKENYQNFTSQSSNLIIEGAGGVMVPLNRNELVLDLIQQLDVEIVVVLKNYLGSINHSLLTLEMLKNKNLNIKGVVFNEETNIESEKYILDYTGLSCIGKIPFSTLVDKSFIVEQAKLLLQNLK